MKTMTYLLLALVGWLLASEMFNAVRAQENGKAVLSPTGGAYGEKTAFIISKIDAAKAKEFREAWRASRNGFFRFEALVLLYKANDGSISARSQGKSTEKDRFTFGWTDDIIAVVHTHPNGDDPKPSGGTRSWPTGFRFRYSL